jgi:hypothetical protein
MDSFDLLRPLYCQHIGDTYLAAATTRTPRSARHRCCPFQRLDSGLLQVIICLFAFMGAFKNATRHQSPRSGVDDRKMTADLVQDGSQRGDDLLLSWVMPGLPRRFKSMGKSNSVRWLTQGNKNILEPSASAAGGARPFAEARPRCTGRATLQSHRVSSYPSDPAVSLSG